MNTRVQRSLTLKSMIVFFVITLLFLALFLAIQFSYLLEQRKQDYLNQLSNTVVQIQKPLTDSLLSSDLNETKRLLISLKTSGIMGKAMITVDNVTVMNLSFATPRPIPDWAVTFLSLPVEMTVPLYAYGNVAPHAKPQGYLTLQVDSNRVYRFALNTLALMTTTYLLLVLIIAIAMTWCVSRMIIRPLRKIAIELQTGNNVKSLDVSDYHQDDELGLLTKGYNRQIKKQNSD
ncbi:MAG: HAMP domain-containing protein [Providencia sp.]|uniref:HAMP domain-containing protein n=1 Tax=Providencia sp. TaxID=589 RepID=UPI003F9633A3